jgi:hypothetical protein
MESTTASNALLWLHDRKLIWQLPNWLVRLTTLRDPAVKQILPELGKRKNATNEKATRMLGREPRSNEDAIVATAESLVRGSGF